jgi:hypothetical protein
VRSFVTGDVVVRPADRRRQPDPDERHAGARSLVHERCGLGADVVDAHVRPGAGPLVDHQVDDVLAVVQAGSEHLARFDRAEPL